MLLKSQPLAPHISKKIAAENTRKCDANWERHIKLQRMGKMLDNILNDDRQRKISLQKRFVWLWRDIKSSYFDLKHAVRNHIRWHQTLRELRPWEGFSGLINVMTVHLQDYISYEQQHGHSTEEFTLHKIRTAQQVIALLKRMKEPDEYLYRRQQEVKIKYPQYKSLITEYKSGGVSCSGDFVAQGDGWVGIESGMEPREGYFEFVGDRFELANSPNQCKTDKLLAQLRTYYKDTDDAYKQAEIDSNADFDRLGQLLKENLYTWWD